MTATVNATPPGTEPRSEQGPSMAPMVNWRSTSTLITGAVVLLVSYALARPNGRVTYTFEFLSFIYLGVAIAILVADRRARGQFHPFTPMLVGLTVMAVNECFFDRLVYVVYDPEFRFRTPDVFPFDLGPFPIPWTMVLGYGFYFALPILLTATIVRRLRPSDPTRTAFLIGLVIGTIPTLVFEQLLVQARIYLYLQTMDGWAVRGGQETQTRIDMVIVMAVFLAALSALWCWRDQRGTWAIDRWADKGATPQARNVRRYAGTTVLVVAIYSLTLIPFAIQKEAGLVDQVSNDQPYEGLPAYNPDQLP